MFSNQLSMYTLNTMVNVSMEFTIVFVPRCLTGFYIKKQGFYAMRLNLYYTI